jgi:hypothetical protein
MIFKSSGTGQLLMYSPASAREMKIETNTSKKQDQMIFFILTSSLRILDVCRVGLLKK